MTPLRGTELRGTGRAAEMRAEVTALAARLRHGGVVPRLAIVVATDDGSTAWYVRSLARAAEKTGVDGMIVRLPSDATAAQVRSKLAELSAAPDVHGIILQTPLPAGCVSAELADAITPDKDVDGANPLSLGRLAAGLPAFAPATAEAVVHLLHAHGVAPAGRTAAIVGRSTVVGKPLAHLLLAEDATVTVCHSRTPDLAAITRRADIVVAAAGRPGLITADHVRDGAVVVDVGTNPTADGGLTGDVDAPSVAPKAALSPVPGGVGPLTTALLLHHTTQAATGASGA